MDVELRVDGIVIAFAKGRGKEEEKEEEKEGNKVHTRSLSPRFEWRERQRLSKRGRGPLERAKGVEISGAGGGCLRQDCGRV